MLEFAAGVPGWAGWTALAFAGAIVGLTKTGVPGVGILAIVLMASVVDAKQSVGLLLPVLIMGDVFAVTYYRRHAVWRHLLRLMPSAFIGIVIGYFLMGAIKGWQLRPLIGAIVIIMLALEEWRARRLAHVEFRASWATALPVGVAAGITTTLANAAGPLITLYFIAMRFEKERFMGTAAWYFLVLNCVKIPFFVAQDPPLVTGASVRAGLCLLPAVAVGALAGILVLKRMSQKWFILVAKILTLAGAIKLLV